MTRENLVTNGSEFITPGGAVYSGPYHVHYSKGAMVGAVHSDTPHDSLTPLNNGVEDKVSAIQRGLRNDMKLKSDYNAAFKRSFSAPLPQRTSRTPSRQTRQSGEMQRRSTPPSTGTSYSSGY